MIKSKTVAFILYVFTFFAFGNILEYLIATYITHSSYVFMGLGSELVMTAVAVITGYLVVNGKC